MKARTIFSSRLLYLVWALGSGVALAIASHVDPYLFGLAAFCAAFVSGLLVLGAALLSWRSLAWVVMAAIPMASAFLLLSSYKWA